MRSSQAAVDALGELHPVVGCLCGERKRHDRDHGKAGGAAEASLESVHHAVPPDCIRGEEPSLPGVPPPTRTEALVTRLFTDT